MTLLIFLVALPVVYVVGVYTSDWFKGLLSKISTK
jgi:hypothetical protein